MSEDKPKKSKLAHYWQYIKQLLSNKIRTREQLIKLMHEASQHQIIDSDSLGMLESVLQFSEMQVREIMIPRKQMIVIHENQSLPQLLKIAADSGHSRFPVLNEDRSEVIGILHAKDLLVYPADKAEQFDLHDVVRPTFIVPESKRLGVLLQEFRANRNHMAIVVDEYGHSAGFVTIEDVIEQIVGDIEDEFDTDEDTYVKQHSLNSYIVKAHMPIEEFNDYFHEPLNDDEFDTVGGVVIHALGHLPKRGEAVDIQRYRFQVLNCDNRRIRLLRVNVV